MISHELECFVCVVCGFLMCVCTLELSEYFFRWREATKKRLEDKKK